MRRPIPSERLAGLDDPQRGLTTAEVRALRERYGPNDLLGASRGTWRDLLRDTLRDPMLWFLLGTSALFALVGDTRESVILLAALIPLLGMDAFLHRRTQASTEGLSARLATHATVVRDGRVCSLPAADLVPGDMVEVASGEPFPADAVFIAGEELQVDESTLTGEAYAVRKQALSGDLRQVRAPVDETHWGFAGTRLLTGRGRLRIVYTGGETLYGEIVRSAARGRHERTPLQLAIARLVVILAGAAVMMCLVLAYVRWLQGHGLVDALLSAVTLAVAALPEEFPVVFTFFLGLGVFRLARRQALVRRAVVVENIGRVTTICSDKTGTITEGRLRVAHYAPAPGMDERDLLQLAAIASREESGDPLDIAILTESGAAVPRRIASFPFVEGRKRETGVVSIAGGRLLAATKGAPETVLALASVDDALRSEWLARAEAFAAGGHKVIACAWIHLDQEEWQGDEPQQGLSFAGLMACEDPVRAGVADAVTECRNAGIRVIMITGDHPATAAAIGREVGLGGGAPRVAAAAEVEAQLGEQQGLLQEIDVVARAVPLQKYAIVQALKARGEIVAVTGDGVNDVPALQAADVGIAMGERGTQSAREVAAIVLLDDNFRSIAYAIAEGQQLFANLRLSFQYLLMIHLPLVLTAALIPLAGYPLLYLPIHIVWLELIIHPTALLAFQRGAGALHLQPPRTGRQVRFFDSRDWLIIVAAGALITLMLAYTYNRSLTDGYDVGHARAMALATLTIASATVAAALSGLRTRGSRAVALLTVLSSIVLIQTPVLAGWLHLTPLHRDDWAIVLAAGSLAALLPAFGRLVPGAAAGRRSPVLNP
jgi:P-type Ca2+ transporter type 2C